MRADALNLHVYPVRTELTGTEQISILHVCSTYEIKSEEFLVGKTLSQICSTDEKKQKNIIGDEINLEESKSECIHKSVDNEKDAKNEAYHEEPRFTDDPFAKEPIYFSIFECVNNLLNKLEATCKQACMATPRDKSYTELYRTITDCNDRNDAPLSNKKI